MPSNDEVNIMEQEEQQETSQPDPAKHPHGEKEQPIGCSWNPDPSEQYQTFTKSGPYTAPGQPE